MRDAEALQRQLVVDGKVGAKVELQQPAVDFLELVDGERFAGFDQFVGEFLEFGEHGLTDNRAADSINIAVHQVCPFFFAAGLFH